MASITTRAGKGSALTNAEVDANFTNLNTDKLEASALTPYLTSATAASTYAPLASPALTGTPTAPTAAVDANTTQLATTAYVVGQGYLKSATASSTYAPLASPALTGTPTAPTAAANTNTTQIATTAFVLGQGNATAGTIAMNGTQAAGTSNLYARADHVHPTDTSRAPLASPTFTGTPAAPTAAVDTNTTQIATTAYVVGQGYLKSATAASTYQTQAGMSSYLTTATAASTYLALAGGTLTGNLAFSGVGRRITADFSAATLADRAAFQSSTSNGNTTITVLPNGTATVSQVAAYSASDPTNTAFMAIQSNGTTNQIISNKTGSGTTLPLLFQIDGTTRATFGATGGLDVATGLHEARIAIAASDIDVRLGNYFTRTISGTTTLTVSNVPAAGKTAAFILELTNAGSATLNFWAGVKWAGGTAPTLTAAGVDILGFYTHDGGTTWRAMLLAKDSK